MSKELGDKTPRTPPSAGGSLSEGLSEKQKITESPDSLGMGRDEATGKPKGPQKGSMGGQRVA